MNLQATLSSENRLKPIFSFKKKLIALFIFLAMSINGYGISAGDIGKYSLVMVAVTAAQGMLTQAVSKCNDSLAIISNKVSVYLSNFLFNSGDDAGLSGNKKSNGGKSSDSAEASKKGITVKETKRQTFDGVDKDSNIWRMSAYGENILQSAPGFWEGIVLISFIMFIIGIRQRKGLGEGIAIIKNTNKIERTKISA
jgi:hypothetical protein